MTPMMIVIIILRAPPLGKRMRGVFHPSKNDSLTCSDSTQTDLALGRVRIVALMVLLQKKNEKCRKGFRPKHG